MTRPGRPAPLLGLTALLLLGPTPARATDCAGLRAAIDAAGAPADPARADAEMQRRRDEIARARAEAGRSGCGDGFFDDPDSELCRTLARRVETMEVGLQRLQDRASRGQAGDDGRRRDLQARFDAECASGDDGDPPGVVTVPADPDAPPGRATPHRAAKVFCVRRCDGAYYPLAVDVPPDRMADMDRICQAQCPASPSSAYAGGGSDDVSEAVATDGTPYTALTAASPRDGGACACRAPHQSWAEALAGAEALLQPQKGDVTVTAELSAAMSRPVVPGQKPAPEPKKGKAKPAPLVLPSPLPDPGHALTREIRRGDPKP